MIDNCLISRAPRPGSAVAKLGLTMPNWNDMGLGTIAPSWHKMFEEMLEQQAQLVIDAMQRVQPGGWFMDTDVGIPYFENTK